MKALFSKTAAAFALLLFLSPAARAEKKRRRTAGGLAVGGGGGGPPRRRLRKAGLSSVALTGAVDLIARAGGGIVSTMKATRAASEDELVAGALPR